MYRTILTTILVTSGIAYSMEHSATNTHPVSPYLFDQRERYVQTRLNFAAAQAKRAGRTQATGTLNEDDAETYRKAGATVHCPYQLTQLVLNGCPVILNKKPGGTCTFTYGVKK